MSSDKPCTLQQLTGFTAQHGMIWIPLGQLPGRQASTDSPADPNLLASFLGLMAQSNSDQGPDRAPPESDRRTGELFGRRIALITRRWATRHQDSPTAHWPGRSIPLTIKASVQGPSGVLAASNQGWTHPSVKPSTFLLYGMTSTPYFKNLRWQYWRTTSAHATGTLWAINQGCHPLYLCHYHPHSLRPC